VVSAIAHPLPRDVDVAVNLTAAIPEKIKDMIHDPARAALVIYALLLSDQKIVLDKQYVLLPKNDQPEIEKIAADIKRLGSLARLPLLEMAIPSLRVLETSERTAFMGVVQNLIRADNRVLPFEFATAVLLSIHLLNSSADQPAVSRDWLGDCMCLLSYLAYAGADRREDRADVFFKAGLAKLHAGHKAILAWDRCGAAEARAALLALSNGPPMEKQKLVEALTACACSDGVITVEEWDILRVFCQCLGCPVPITPPVLNG
jgi:hypothetical protein